MKFSLVMATLGRSEEIKIFLDSLSVQDYKNFELIIVDQNERDILRDIVDEYKQKFYNEKSPREINFSRGKH